MRSVNWTAMADGTREDYEYLGSIFVEHARNEVIGNVVGLLERMAGPKLGYQIDRYQHSLQSATRALRADERVDLVVGALLHDVGDTIAPENHSALAAAILRPYVDDETHWVVRHHGLFQGYYYFHHFGGDRHARDRFVDEPYYEACVAFCEKYDQNCFDPDYDTLPLRDFVPMLEEVFSRESRIPGMDAGAIADDLL